MSDAWPMIGRDSERAAIHAAVRDHERSGLVLAGPPGTGKTRLALDARAVADDAGWLTLLVAGSRAAAGLPLAAMAPLVPPDVLSGSDLPLLLSRAHDALVERKGDRDLLIVVDDAHALDDASALLTYQLAATGTAYVVATVRTGEPVPDSITALWKDGLAGRIDLEPLAREDVEQLVTVVLGGPVADPTIRELALRSGGNALYLRELVTGAQENGTLVISSGLWRLTSPPPTTPRLAELIRANLAGLDDEQRRIVELLAVGEPTGVADLVRAEGGHRALDQLEQRGLVQVVAHGRRLVVRFGHPLYGDVVRGDLPERRRRAAARELADAVAATGTRRHDDALRMAIWRLQAGDLTDQDLFLAGARTALKRHDYLLTSELADAAVDAGGGFEARLLAASARSLIGDGDGALAALDAIDRAGLDARQWFEIQLVRLETYVYVQGRMVDAVELIDETLVDETPCAARDEIEFYRHQIGFLLGVPSAGDRVAEIGARVTGGLRGVILGTHAMNLVNVGRFDEVGELCDIGLGELERATEPVRWSSQGFAVFRGNALAELGRLDEAERIGADGYQACLAARQFDMLSWLGGTLSRVALLRGDVGQAINWARQAASSTAALGRSYFAARAHLDHALALAAAGSAAEATAAIELAVATGVAGPGFDAQVGEARGWVRAATGDIPGAHTRFLDAAAAARAATYYGVELSCLHAVRRIGRRVGPTRVAELRGLVDGPLAAAKIAHLQASDAAGLLAAAAAFEALGTLLFAAEAAADAAVAHHSEGDSRAATAALRRVEALSVRCPAARTPALRPVEVRHRLTATEHRVAELAARGMRSKEIAEELTVSTRTVDNTLQRVYVKLGIGGRGDLREALAHEPRPAPQG